MPAADTAGDGDTVDTSTDAVINNARTRLFLIASSYLPESAYRFLNRAIRTDSNA